jgi:hypothetical protein
MFIALRTSNLSLSNLSAQVDYSITFGISHGTFILMIRAHKFAARCSSFQCHAQCSNEAIYFLSKCGEEVTV